MNIVDALNSGKRFRRKSWSNYICYSGEYRFTFLDVVTDDQEVEEKSVIIITAAEFQEAWERAAKKAEGNDIAYDNYPSFRDLVAKELGL